MRQPRHHSEFFFPTDYRERMASMERHNKFVRKVTFYAWGLSLVIVVGLLYYFVGVFV